MVRTGHVFYIYGQIPSAKAKRMGQKFSTLYETGLGKLEQSRKRKRGQASFRWLAWLDEPNEIVHWVLCRTEGECPPEAGTENWQNALDQKLRIVGGYELVKLNKAKEPNPVWTWRYTMGHYDNLRDSLIRHIRTRRDDLLHQLIHEVWRTPGFAGARDQVKKIKKMIVSDWKRTRGGDPLPEIPERIGYVRRLKDVGHVL